MTKEERIEELSRSRQAYCEQASEFIRSGDYRLAIRNLLEAQVDYSTTLVLANLNNSQEVAELKRELAELNETFKFTLKTKEELQERLDAIENDLRTYDYLYRMNESAKRSIESFIAMHYTSPTPSEDEAGVVSEGEFIMYHATKECWITYPGEVEHPLKSKAALQASAWFGGYDPSVVEQARNAPGFKYPLRKRP